MSTWDDIIDSLTSSNAPAPSDPMVLVPQEQPTPIVAVTPPQPAPRKKEDDWAPPAFTMMPPPVTFLPRRPTMGGILGA